MFETQDRECDDRLTLAATLTHFSYQRMCHPKTSQTMKLQFVAAAGQMSMFVSECPTQTGFRVEQKPRIKTGLTGTLLRRVFAPANTTRTCRPPPEERTDGVLEDLLPDLDQDVSQLLETCT